MGGGGGVEQGHHDRENMQIHRPDAKTEGKNVCPCGRGRIVDVAVWGGALLPRWCSVLKSTVRVNVMSRQDVASEVARFTPVCVLVSLTDTTSALVISAITFESTRREAAAPATSQNVGFARHTHARVLNLLAARFLTRHKFKRMKGNAVV